MSGANGNGQANGNGHASGPNGAVAPVVAKKLGKTFGTHDERGKFAVGNPGGPGRPKGSLDLMKIAREQAKRTGHSLDKVVEIVLRALTRSAVARDTNAAKVLLDRLCGAQEKAPTVNVGIDARGGDVAVSGPPIPDGADFEVYVEKLNQVAVSQGMANAEAIERARAQEQELEDLLG